jgi:hypothetical protein
MHPQNAILEEHFEFLSQKMTFLKDIFGNSCDFHKFAQKFAKNVEPLLNPGMNLQPQEH